MTELVSTPNKCKARYAAANSVRAFHSYSLTPNGLPLFWFVCSGRTVLTISTDRRSNSMLVETGYPTILGSGTGIMKLSSSISTTSSVSSSFSSLVGLAVVEVVVDDEEEVVV